MGYLKNPIIFLPSLQLFLGLLQNLEVHTVSFLRKIIHRWVRFCLSDRSKLAALHIASLMLSNPLEIMVTIIVFAWFLRMLELPLKNFVYFLDFFLMWWIEGIVISFWSLFGCPKLFLGFRGHVFRVLVRLAVSNLSTLWFFALKRYAVASFFGMELRVRKGCGPSDLLVSFILRKIKFSLPMLINNI